MSTYAWLLALWQQPALWADHASGYAQLAAAEAAEAVRVWRLRGVCLVAALLLLALGVSLAGVALLVWAAVPMAQMPHPEGLLWVPGTPLLGAALMLGLRQRWSSAELFQHMRQQLAADREVLVDWKRP